MEQYPVLQKHSKIFGFEREFACGTLDQGIEDVNSLNEQPASLFRFYEQIDNDVFLLDFFPSKNSNLSFIDSENLQLFPENIRKASFGSLEDSLVLTDFKSYIHKLSYEQNQMPEEEIEHCVQKSRIMKWTGTKNGKSTSKNLFLRKKKDGKFTIERCNHKRSKRNKENSKKSESNSKISTENSLFEKFNAEHRGQTHLSEEERIVQKIFKVDKYWKSISSIIPNVFRIISETSDSEHHFSEYQDLSSKEVLAQNGGCKPKMNQLSLKKKTSKQTE